MAYSPRTGLAYFPVAENGRIVARDPTFKLHPGEMSQLGTTSQGYDDLRRKLEETDKRNTKFYLIAYDPVKQKEVWRVPYKRGANGGVLATAGGLVFEGTSAGTFAAYDDRSGSKLWEMPVQQVPISGPISYSLDGVQYVAVNAGFGGGLAHDNVSFGEMHISDYGRLLVFKLDGKVKLPALVERPSAIAPPPKLAYTMGEVKSGEALFDTNCAVCHGDNARGGVKDLRKMSPHTHAEFFDIVLGGKRAQNGMANFSDKLSHKDAELIHKYIVARINEDWADLKSGK
jgi:quinohemoprotein ethanol dehydrogenase